MGKVYTPCVCYPVPDILLPTVEKMVKEEKAYIYENRVFFQNGKVITKEEAKLEPKKEEKKKASKKEKVIEEPVKEPTDEADATPPDEDEGF